MIDINKDGMVSIAELAAISRTMGYALSNDEIAVRMIISSTECYNLAHLALDKSVIIVILGYILQARH